MSSLNVATRDDSVSDYKSAAVNDDAMRTGKSGPTASCQSMGAPSEETKEPGPQGPYEAQAKERESAREIVAELAGRLDISRNDVTKLGKASIEDIRDFACTHGMTTDEIQRLLGSFGRKAEGILNDASAAVSDGIESVRNGHTDTGSVTRLDLYLKRAGTLFNLLLAAVVSGLLSWLIAGLLTDGGFWFLMWLSLLWVTGFEGFTLLADTVRKTIRDKTREDTKSDEPVSEGTVTGGKTETEAHPGSSPVTRLDQLTRAFEIGLITIDEYEKKRAEVEDPDDSRKECSQDDTSSETQPSNNEPVQEPTDPEIEEKLVKLDVARQAGLISEDEYEEKRAQLFSRTDPDHGEDAPSDEDVRLMHDMDDAITEESDSIEDSEGADSDDDDEES